MAGINEPVVDLLLDLDSSSDEADMPDPIKYPLLMSNLTKEREKRAKDSAFQKLMISRDTQKERNELRKKTHDIDDMLPKKLPVFIHKDTDTDTDDDDTDGNENDDENEVEESLIPAEYEGESQEPVFIDVEELSDQSNPGPIDMDYWPEFDSVNEMPLEEWIVQDNIRGEEEEFYRSELRSSGETRVYVPERVSEELPKGNGIINLRRRSKDAFEVEDNILRLTRNISINSDETKETNEVIQEAIQTEFLKIVKSSGTSVDLSENLLSTDEFEYHSTVFMELLSNEIISGVLFHVSEINLELNKIDNLDSVAKMLGSFKEMNSPIKTINLKSNCFADISPLLSMSNSLTSIDLSFNDLSDEVQSPKIAQLMNQCFSLKNLYLDQCSLNKHSISFLHDKLKNDFYPLQEISLNGNSLRNQGLDTLFSIFQSHSFPELKKLHLEDINLEILTESDYNETYDMEFFKAFLQDYENIHLNLARNYLDEFLFELILNSKSFSSLKFTTMGETQLDQLSREIPTTLKHLDISYGSSFLTIKESLFTNLQTLNLSNCDMTPEIFTDLFKHFIRNTQIHEIDFSSNNLLGLKEEEFIPLIDQASVHPFPVFSVLNFKFCDLDEIINIITSYNAENSELFKDKD